MSVWVEKLIIPLLLLILGGIGTIVWQYITTPDSIFLAGRVQAVSVPNPLSSIDINKFGDFEKALKTAFNLNGEKLLDAKYHSQLNVIEIKINNVSAIRSKEIEIVSKENAILYSPVAKVNANGLTKKIVIQPIDPFDSATIYGLIGRSYSSVTASVAAIHDNKRLPLVAEGSMMEIDSVLGAIALQSPLIVSALIFLGALTGLILLLVLPLEIAMAFVPRLRAKWTNEQQIAKSLNVFDLLEKHFPDKLAKARALQRSKPESAAPKPPDSPTETSATNP